MLDTVELRDFRNVAEARLELAPRFTVLTGHNGAGKTGVLEAIYLVATLRSFRTSDLGALVRHGCDSAQVQVRAHDAVAGVPTTLSVRLQRGAASTRRTAVADGKTVRSGAQFYGRVRGVLFTPEDLGVLRGSPSGRRQFLDRVVFARDRSHITDVSTYDKVVRSRNTVLRRDDLSARERGDLLDTYETQLATVGARLWARRVDVLHQLCDPFAATFRRIHGRIGPAPTDREATDLSASVRYVSKLGEIPADERHQALANALRERRAEDERRGVTTVGPHRDDLAVELDGRLAADFASQGQSRALVLAFKLAELDAARAEDGTRPLLLLDDVSSELDPQRSQMLFETLGEAVGQCVLTTTAAEFIRLPTGSDAVWWHVDRGTIRA